MNEKKEDRRRRFAEDIGQKQSRRIRKKRRGDDSLWFGMGMFGLVGWSVAIPILLGLAVGLYLDNRLAGSYSWTLMMLGAGVILGAVNAWYWISKERDKIEMERREEDEHD